MNALSPARKVLAGALLLTWTLFVLIAFYAVQKPVMPAGPGEPSELEEIALAISRAFPGPLSITGPVNALADLLVAFLLSIAALVAGDLVLRRRTAPTARGATERLERWLMAGGVGLGAIGVATYVCGFFGLLSPLLLGGLFVAAPLALGWRRLREFWVDVSVLRRVLLPAPLRLLIVSTLGLALLSALAPPIAYDSWLYHLAIPQRALEEGRVSALLQMIPPEGWPQLMSGVYLLAMTLRSDVVAQVLHFDFCVMTLLMVGLAAHRDYFRNGNSPASLALVLTISMPMVALLAGWAYNDLALAFYTSAAVYAYRRHLADGLRHYLALAAAMAAFAIGMKYTAFVLPLGIVFHLLWTFRREALRPASVFTLLTALLAAPWFLKNLFFYGNPVYPFLFGGAQWDGLRSVWYAQFGTGIGLDAGALLTLPIVAMQGYRDATLWDGRIGPLLLMCAPLLVLRQMARTPSSLDRTVAWHDPYLLVAALGVLFWVAGVMSSSALWQSRLLLPSLVLAIPALADAVEGLRDLDLPSVSFARVFRVLVALVLALGLLRQGVEFAKLNPLGYLLGSETREAFQERQWQEHVRAMRALNQLPPAVRVQFLWEPRTYLARRPVVADVLLDALPHVTTISGGLDAGVRHWKSEGITHLLIFDGGAQVALRDHINAYSPADAANLERLRSEFTREVYRNSAYSLLELR